MCVYIYTRTSIYRHTDVLQRSYILHLVSFCLFYLSSATDFPDKYLSCLSLGTPQQSKACGRASLQGESLRESCGRRLCHGRGTAGRGPCRTVGGHPPPAAPPPGRAPGPAGGARGRGGGQTPALPLAGNGPGGWWGDGADTLPADPQPGSQPPHPYLAGPSGRCGPPPPASAPGGGRCGSAGRGGAGPPRLS